jgi:predicted nucleic acid-binding Zn ribbon protein
MTPDEYWIQCDVCGNPRPFYMVTWTDDGMFYCSERCWDIAEPPEPEQEEEEEDLRHCVVCGKAYEHEPKYHPDLCSRLCCENWLHPPVVGPQKGDRNLWDHLKKE